MNRDSLRLVILDRDDTLVIVPPGRRYIYGEDTISFAPCAPECIKRANNLNIPVVVVSNQQGVSLSEFPDMTLSSVHRFDERINIALADYGARIDRFYICPHHENEGCICRKPNPGLVLQALADYRVPPSNALLLGNSMRDICAARAASVKGILIVPHKFEAPSAVESAGSMREALSFLF